jgi:hypothetical protein
MNTKQKKVLKEIFAQPTRANLAWKEIESLLAALGAEMEEGNGSRVRIALNGIRTVFHRPHPRREAGKGTVESVRDFLIEANISPEQ